MVEVCCCNCSLRTAVMILAIMSACHFLMESAAIFSIGTDHRLVAAKDSGLFYTIASAQIIMIVLSILLFAGAYARIIWLCLPWLVLNALNIIYHTFIIVLFLSQIFGAYELTKLEILALLVFSVAILVYMEWLVLRLIQQFRKGDSISSNTTNRDEEYPLIK